jgi:hypothetical protein
LILLELGTATSAPSFRRPLLQNLCRNKHKSNHEPLLWFLSIHLLAVFRLLFFDRFASCSWTPHKIPQLSQREDGRDAGASLRHHSSILHIFVILPTLVHARIEIPSHWYRCHWDLHCVLPVPLRPCCRHPWRYNVIFAISSTHAISTTNFEQDITVLDWRFI